MKNTLDKFSKFTGSNKFFILTLIFFIFQSAWIALSAAYPMAFDENFHFGLIKVYSHYWWPWLSHQPPNSNAYGAVTRDPSYLYHYLMSFPYRLISQIFHEQLGQIISLRFINIILFTIGLYLIRKILRRSGLSKSLTNISIFLFTFIPIVPQLAAQINYDNMLIPLVALNLLLAFKITDQIRNKNPSIVSIIELVSLSFMTSIEKYAYEPIFLGLAIYLFYVSYKTYNKPYKQFFIVLLDNWREQKFYLKMVLLSILIISVSFFAQRDVINLIQYHAIAPSCSKVLNVKECKSYSPWYYNYKNHKKVISGHVKFNNPLQYTLDWLYWMWYRLFFAVNGPASSFKNYPPLPLPSAAALLIALFGIISTIKWRKMIFKENYYMLGLFIVSAVYLITLFGQGYYTYSYTAVLENMNGRYLLPVLLFVIAIFGRALSLQLRKSVTKKSALALIAIILFMQGGGFLTFIVRSNSSWYISNPTVIKINKTAKHITRHVVVKGKKHYSSPFWIFN